MCNHRERNLYPLTKTDHTITEKHPPRPNHHIERRHTTDDPPTHPEVPTTNPKPPTLTGRARARKKPAP